MFIEVTTAESNLELINTSQILKVRRRPKSTTVLELVGGGVLELFSSYDEICMKLEKAGVFLPFEATNKNEEEGYNANPNDNPEHY
jgi:hypothetical protein